MMDTNDSNLHSLDVSPISDLNQKTITTSTIQGIRDGLVFNHSPISHLAPELLSLIFLIRVLDDKTNYDFNFHAGSLSSWHTVLHVCSRWRAIAIGTPSLWAYWNFANSRWQAISLTNSKMVDIYIRATVTDTAYPQIKTMLGNPEVAKRIRELHLEGQHWKLGYCMKTFLTTTQGGDHVESRVESIMIGGEKLAHTYMNPVASDSISYSRRLGRFDLFGCREDFPSWVVKSFVSLTYLGLHSIEIRDETCLPALLHVLKNNPLLKTLKLGFVTTFSTLFNVNNIRAPYVSLNSLEDLEVTGLMLDSVKLMDFLNYPVNITSVKYNLDYHGSRESSSLPGLVSRHYVPGTNDTEEYLLVARFNMQRQWEAPSFSFQCSNVSSIHTNTFNLNLRGDWNEGRELSTVFHRILLLLPLARTTRMDFPVNGYNFTKEECRNNGLFGQFDKLQTLNIEEFPCVFGIITGFAQDLAIAPQLMSLGITRTTFRCAGYNLVDYVKAFLDGRANVMEHLIIRKCMNFTAEDYQRLAKNRKGLTIEWDREEKYCGHFLHDHLKNVAGNEILSGLDLYDSEQEF